MVFRSEDKSRRGRGPSAMDALPDGAGGKATNFSTPKNFMTHANGDLAMPQGTSQRAAEIVISPEDELSIDDLDRIVGGLNGDQLPAHEGGDGGYVSPAVDAP